VTRLRWLAAFALALTAALPVGAQDVPAISYRVDFAGAAHRWLEVDATFPSVDAAPLRVRMSRSSPGRYATHEFAKNVFSFEAFDGAGKPLAVTRTEPDEWAIGGHDGTVRVVYRIFGDHADGTYLGVDTTHGHLNMPATFVWAVGLELRPIRIAFVPPAGSGWKAATQLFATAAPLEFTAPNLQYFMDSPTELSNFLMSTFQVDDPAGKPATFRVVVHGDASQADVDALAAMIKQLVAEQADVFGEFPPFEPGHYTFLLDLVEWASSDGMEHRNSTYISIPGLSLRTAQGRRLAMGSIAHEFFHVWNVERIRPADLEPFNLTRANVSCCLWLAEGFTEYYGTLTLARANLGDEAPLSSVASVAAQSGRLVRSAVQMSEHAPFTDRAVATDMSDARRSYISYYEYGEVLALALDLSLRARSGGRRSLDDFMRRLWQDFGRASAPRPGYVARPYTLADVRATLAAVANDKRFADEFFDRYIEGREWPDFASLLSPAGYVVQPVAPGRAWAGDVPVEQTDRGVRVGHGRGGRTLVSFGTPLYDAGIDVDDVITQIDGQPATLAHWNSLAQRKPGDTTTLAVRRRDGETITATVTLAVDPRVLVLPVEAAGVAPTPAQRAFRQAWLN
jgi:predicted metalloprotease with PDZ domain